MAKQVKKIGERWAAILTGFLTNNWVRCDASLVSVTGPVLLAGPPGTGKSTLAEYLLGIDSVVRVICHKKQSLRDLVGSTQIRGGDTVTVIAAAAKAMNEGKLLVLDEIDKHSPDCTGFLHALLDDPRIAHAQLPDGQIIKAKPGFGVVATTNAMPSALPEALLDRFGVYLPALVPSDGLLDTFDAAHREIVTNHYSRVAGNWPSWSGEISARRVSALGRLTGAGVEIEEAAQLTFGDSGPQIVKALTVAGVATKKWSNPRDFTTAAMAVLLK